jgi:hypothetical protein
MKHTRTGAWLVTALWLSGMVAPASGQQTSIRGFADVTFRVSDDDAENSSFQLGQYDLFFSSRLGEGWRFLAETVFEYDGGSFIVDVERVQIHYAVAPGISLVAGKQHTPIGYWNTEYHHGSLLQPTIQRPSMYLFEDEGGVLPIHTMGLGISGRGIGKQSLKFDVLLGNGIGSSPVEDNNGDKSVTVSVSSRLHSSARVGVSAYTTAVTAGVAAPDGHEVEENFRQSILGPTVVYDGRRLEMRAEYLRIWNGTDARTTATNALYAYLGIRSGRLVTYGRFDRIASELGDLYFENDESNQYVVGARWDASALSVLKFEFQTTVSDLRGTTRRMVGQVAVSF